MAEAPHREIYHMVATFSHGEEAEQAEPLMLEHSLWADTVLATGHAVAVVLYTGKETRAVLNASVAQQKAGALDLQLNTFSKVAAHVHIAFAAGLRLRWTSSAHESECAQILFVMTMLMAFSLTALKVQPSPPNCVRLRSQIIRITQGFRGIWYIYLFRFVLLLSAIIPIRCHYPAAAWLHLVMRPGAQHASQPGYGQDALLAHGWGRLATAWAVPLTLRSRLLRS